MQQQQQQQQQQQDAKSTPRHITTPWHIKLFFEKRPGVPTIWQVMFIGFWAMVAYKMFASQGEVEEQEQAQNSIVSVNAITWTFASLVVIFPLFLRANYRANFYRLQRNINTIISQRFSNCNNFDKDTVCAAIEDYLCSGADNGDYNRHIAKYLKRHISHSSVSDANQPITKSQVKTLFNQLKDEQAIKDANCCKRICP